MEKKTKYSEITPEDIQDMKARHGDVLSEIKITSGDGKVACFVVKPPSRSVIDAVGQYGSQKNITAANKALISNCVLGGDTEEMERNGGVYASLLTELNKLVKTKEVLVKKL